MKGGGFGGVSVAGSEVNAHCEVDLTATHDVLQEGVGLCDLHVCVCVCVCWGGEGNSCSQSQCSVVLFYPHLGS